MTSAGTKKGLSRVADELPTRCCCRVGETAQVSRCQGTCLVSQGPLGLSRQANIHGGMQWLGTGTFSFAMHIEFRWWGASHHTPYLLQFRDTAGLAGQGCLRGAVAKGLRNHYNCPACHQYHFSAKCMASVAPQEPLPPFQTYTYVHAHAKPDATCHRCHMPIHGIYSKHYTGSLQHLRNQ